MGLKYVGSPIGITLVMIIPVVNDVLTIWENGREISSIICIIHLVVINKILCCFLAFICLVVLIMAMGYVGDMYIAFRTLMGIYL